MLKTCLCASFLTYTWRNFSYKIGSSPRSPGRHVCGCWQIKTFREQKLVTETAENYPKKAFLRIMFRISVSPRVIAAAGPVTAVTFVDLEDALILTWRTSERLRHLLPQMRDFVHPPCRHSSIWIPLISSGIDYASHQVQPCSFCSER